MDNESEVKLLKEDQNVNSLDKNDAAPDRKGRKLAQRSKSVRELMEDSKTRTEEVISVLSSGTSLHKVRALDKFYSRRYFIDLENMRLHYGPSIKQYLCREVPYIDLCDLSEVRKGWESDRFNVIESRFRRKLHASIEPKNLPTLREDNCFSLVFDNRTETEDLVATDSHVRDLWVKGLSYLVATCKNQQRENEYEFWLKEQFRKADHNKNGILDFQEVMKILHQMNISMNKKHAKALFNLSLTPKHRLHLRTTEEGLDSEGFLKFYQMINTRPELEKIFKQYSVNKTCIMGPEELLHFLEKEQKMSLVSIADCEAYIKRYEPEESEVPGYMSIKGFRNLFMSIDFDIFNRRHRTVCQEMSEPLSHYFIASSHNTYLMSGQLTGSSSIEAYRLALETGCRCLELDVWDGEDGEPIIYHGYTLVTKIHLRDVLKTIHKYAFKSSQFPLILSMENHCSLEQQSVMASLMVDILGEYLIREPIDKNEKHWPSPESLARKILIKGKKLPTIKAHKRLKRALDMNLEEEEEDLDFVGEEAEDGDEKEEELEENNENDLSSEEELSESEMKDNGIIRRHTFPVKIKSSDIESAKSDETILQSESQESDDKHLALGITVSAPNRMTSHDMKASEKMKLSKDFSDLVTYCVAKKFISFKDSFKKWKFYEMVSFEETKSENFAKTKAEEYVKFNKNHLTRVYPKGTRTDSSNYNPIPHWNMGSQLVALNYQTRDKPMIFNEALFALNGKCGYVLKAEYLRKGLQFGKSGRSSVINSPTNKPKRVYINIISGQHIPKPGNTLDGEVIDPYVKLKVYGHPEDKFEFTTKCVKNNGFNPIWEEKTEFTVRLPEMAFIYFVVKDQSTTGKNSMLGQYMLSFPAIMEGYRTVRLVDHNSQPLIAASLLINVSFKDIADYWTPT